MDNKIINKFLRKIYSTETDEISCSECFERVSGYVERKSVGMDLSEDKQLRQHLLECDVCREEAEALLDLYLLDEMEDINASAS